MQVRKPKRDELWVILRDLPPESDAKLIYSILDPVAALSYIDKGYSQVFIVDGYLVVYEVAAPWYSRKTILSELLVVRVEEGGTLKSVAQFLRLAAKEHRAEFIAVGTALAKSDRALSRLYQAEGFRPEAITLVMEP